MKYTNLATTYLLGLQAQKHLDSFLNDIFGFSIQDVDAPFIEGTTGDTYDWSLEIHIYQCKNPEQFKITQEQIDAICNQGISHFYLNFYTSTEEDSKAGDCYCSRKDGQYKFR